MQCYFPLHNFVRINQLYEDEFYDNGGNEQNNIIDDENGVDEEDGPAMNAMKAWRNGIADAMRAQYQLHLANL